VAYLPALRRQGLEGVVADHAAIAHDQHAAQVETFPDVIDGDGQRGAVGGVAGKNVMGYRPAVGHDHAEDNLDVSRPAVLAHAVPAKVALGPATGEVCAGDVVEHDVDFEAEEVAYPAIEILLDIFLAGQESVERAIPLLQLAAPDAHALLFRDGFVRQPFGQPSIAVSIRHVGVLEPAGEGVFAARVAESVGHKHEGHLGHVRLASRRFAARGDDAAKAQLLPEVTGEEDFAAGQRLEHFDIGFRQQFCVGELRECVDELAELWADFVHAAEIEHDALLVFAIFVVRFEDAEVFVIAACALDFCPVHVQKHGELRRRWGSDCDVIFTSGAYYSVSDA